MHKRNKKMNQKVLYKHINNWIPAPCLRLAGAGYNMQGLGQAAGDPSEITLRYLTGQADFTDFVFGGKCGIWFY